jgi:hypothetical protein
MGSLYNAGPYNPGVYSHGNLWSFAGGLAFTIGFAGDIKTPIDLSGALAFSPAFSGQASAAFSLAGNLSPLVTLGGALGASYGMSAGNIPVQPALAASTMTSGPLWAPDDAQCPAPPWGASTPCTG